jgi:(p)ppGpp synthase/HD superfamily hydrolase
MSLNWDAEEGVTTRATLEVVATDRVGLLAHITAVVADSDLNITGAQVEAESGQFARLVLTLSLKHRAQLERVMERLGQLIDVISVRQIKSP